MKLKPLAEQTMVITGASSGIGLATARRAARAGANVVLVARNDEALGKIATEINAAGKGRATHIALDIADPDAPQRIGDAADAAFGGFDSWANVAAAAMYARLRETTIEEHKRVFDVGYFGTVAASLYAVERLSTQGGALINVGSVLSDRAIPIQGAYSSMKHAVKGFTEALREEVEMDRRRVSVTLIKPNGINTPYPEHARNKMGQPARIPPVLYDPELVAKAICFCAEQSRRTITVGGQGMMISVLGNVFPRLSDKIIEAGFGEQAQTSDTPPEPGAQDNLFAAREDGRERSNQDVFVRKTSLAMEMQLRPTLSTAAALVVGGVAAVITEARRRSR